MLILDTNACIAVMTGRPIHARQHFDQATKDRQTIAVSVMSVSELWYGVAASDRIEFNTERLTAFLAPLPTLHFDDDDGRIAGFIRADLRKRGTPIGPYDLLIAAQALRRSATVITANVREFSRIEGLRWEDWSR